MFENQTWNEIFEMLRDITMALGRAPKIQEVKGGLVLVNSLKHGGWSYVLGYAGIYPRAGQSRKQRFPVFLDDFTDDQITSLVKKSAWKKGSTPLERDCWYYPEMIRRWGSWPEAMAAYGMKMHPDYKPYNPLPCDFELFFDSTVRPIRSVPYSHAGHYRRK